MSVIPQDFQFLFPSSPVENLQIDQDKEYIVSTLLKNATLPAWKWLLKTYSKEDISRTLKTTKTLTKKDVMIWVNYLDIPTSDVVCLQEKSPTGPKNSWVY